MKNTNILLPAKVEPTPNAQRRPVFYVGVPSVESILNGTDKPLSEILKVNQSNRPNDLPRYIWDEMQNPFSSILP